MLNTSLVRRGYDQIAARYTESRDQGSSVPYMEMLHHRLAANSLVLDLGCGAGLPVDRWLTDKGHRVIGLDLSPEMLVLARKNVPQAHYELRDLVDLKAGEYTADAVVSFFAMFHIDRSLHRQFLGCVRSYLPPGGLLLITTGRSEWEGEEDFMGTQMAFSHFDRAANRALIKDAGFAILFEGQHPGSLCDDNGSHPIFLARAN